MINVALDSAKRPLAGWLWEELADLEFSAVYDAFSGAGKVAAFFKQKGYQVFTSDILQSHYWRNKGLIENNNDLITPQVFNAIVQAAGDEAENSFQAWADHYFTQDEVQALGTWWHNIEHGDTFTDNANLKGLARAAVYMVINYWQNFNQSYLQPKAMGPRDVLEYYVQILNDKVYDNQMPNAAYYTNTYDLVANLPADVIWIYPPAMTGFRNTNRKTELNECWTTRTTQMNLEGVMATENQLGAVFSDDSAYALALGEFLDQCQSNRIWAVCHDENLGISKAQMETVIGNKRSIWKKAGFNLPYPFSGGEDFDQMLTLYIAVAE